MSRNSLTTFPARKYFQSIGSQTLLRDSKGAAKNKSHYSPRNLRVRYRQCSTYNTQVEAHCNEFPKTCNLVVLGLCSNEGIDRNDFPHLLEQGMK